MHILRSTKVRVAVFTWVEAAIKSYVAVSFVI